MNKDQANLYINKGLQTSGDVFAILDHVSACKECQARFQEIVAHSKKPIIDVVKPKRIDKT